MHVSTTRLPAGVGCGAAASGHYQWNNPEQIAQLLLCMVMAGPFLTGYTQTVNDWYDRDIDAINEPYRPIPSGKISSVEVIAQIWILLIGGIGTAYLLDQCAPLRTRHTPARSAAAAPAQGGTSSCGPPACMWHHHGCRRHVVVRGAACMGTRIGRNAAFHRRGLAVTGAHGCVCGC